MNPTQPREFLGVLHFQIGNHAQAKLVRVIKGKVLGRGGRHKKGFYDLWAICLHLS